MKILTFNSRTEAAKFHFLISALVLAFVGMLVFMVWYPYPYAQIADVFSIFSLLMMVDVLLGPLITLIIFNLKKPQRERILDFSVICFIQIIALCFGLWTMFTARPVGLVWEYDRFRVIHATDVPTHLLSSNSGPKFSMFTVRLVGLRDVSQIDLPERTLLALSGVHLGAQLDLWQPFDKSRPEVLAAAKPLDELLLRFKDQSPVINQAVRDAGMPAEQLRWVRMLGRKQAWTVLIDAKTAEPKAFIPLDSF
jgi:hypothetical protein